MLAELVAFTLQCTLPSSTPITITKHYEPMTTCATVLAGPPPNMEDINPCGMRPNCHYHPAPPIQYKTWQQYCDAQTLRPCRFPSDDTTYGWFSWYKPSK